MRAKTAQQRAKLFFAEENKWTSELCVDLLGADGMLFDPNDRRSASHAALSTSDLCRSFLRARGNSIEGGTSEVMRNIIGERVLDLPGEPRIDKNLPWKDVRRS